MYSLCGKVAIITGGAKGIGAAIVNEFSKENVKFIAILDVDDVSGIELEKAINLRYGRGKSKFFKCDVTNSEKVYEIFDNVVNKFENIDIIVNNAGISTEDLNTFKKEIEVNYTAVVSSTLKGLQLMRVDHGGKGGTIINVSSIVALRQQSPFLFVYSGTKSAVLHFSNCIGMEDYYRHTQVRVLTVCFGGTETNLLDAYKSYDKIILDTMSNIINSERLTASTQSAEVAAKGMVHSYKNGKSGSTWLISGGKFYNVTDNITQSYKIMSKEVESEDVHT